MSQKEKEPQDIESELIQKMSSMIANMEAQNKKNFFAQLLDSAPSIFITIVGVSISFYMYVNIELNKITQRLDYRAAEIAEIQKNVREIKEELRGFDRRLYSNELKVNPQK